MKNEKRSQEPVVWLLFGAGTTIAAMFFPILILIFGVLLPFDLISADNLISFSQTILGKIIASAILIFPVWGAMHRIHHGLHDFKIHLPASGWVFYGLSVIYSIVALLILW